jgi:hypothetical protein
MLSRSLSSASVLRQIRLLPIPHTRIRPAEVATMKRDSLELRLVLVRPAPLPAAQIPHVPELEGDEPLLGHCKDHDKYSRLKPLVSSTGRNTTTNATRLRAEKSAIPPQCVSAGSSSGYRRVRTPAKKRFTAIATEQP